MSRMHEQIKDIREKVNKAEAIDRNLKKARQDYEDGYYLDCMDAAKRVQRLDGCIPEADDLCSKAYRRKGHSKPRRAEEPWQRKPRSTDEPSERKPRSTDGPCRTAGVHSAKVVDAKVVAPTSNIVRRSCSQDEYRKKEIIDYYPLFYAIGIIVTVILVYLAFAHIILPVVAYVWWILKLSCMFIVYVITAVGNVFASLFSAIGQFFEWIFTFVFWIWEGLRSLIP